MKNKSLGFMIALIFFIGCSQEEKIQPPVHDFSENISMNDEFYFETLVNGRAGTVMPSWRAQGLTDEEMWHLVDFIKSEPN